MCIYKCTYIYIYTVFLNSHSYSCCTNLCVSSCSSPGCQQVTEEFSPDWDWVLVGSQQVVVARVDGRGSGFRGQRSVPVTCPGCILDSGHRGAAVTLRALLFVAPLRVLTAIYQGLGTVDVDDQLAALECVALSAHLGALG